MSFVSDYGEWSERHLAALSDAETLRAVMRHRTLRLLLVTIVERWGRRGLTAAEIVRGLGASEEARKSIAGFLGAGNHSGYSEGSPRKWCVKDSDGRWHPLRPLRWDPWMRALTQRRSA